MSDMEGKAVPALAKGQKAGLSLNLHGGRVMPQTFGQVVEFAQMMCKAGLAIPKHLRDNPGVCLSVIQRSLAWEMDPWAVATKTYAVNDILAYEAQLVAAVVKKWAPIRERVIPYVFTGEGGELQCSITLHHAETGEEIFYQTPKRKDIKTQNSPLWSTEPQQQMSYYAIRAMCRRHFPEILLGVYDRDEVMAMKDITPDKPVENYLNDEPEPTKTLHEIVAEKPIEGEILGQPNVVDETDPEPEDIALLRAIEGHTDAVLLQQWQHDNHARINALPPDMLKRVRKALADRLFELEKT
jgi:hypothetical protein